jgi:hypothetical protein
MYGVMRTDDNCVPHLITRHSNAPLAESARPA